MSDKLKFFIPPPNAPLYRVGTCEACGKETSWPIGSPPACKGACTRRYEAMRRLKDPEPTNHKFNMQNVRRRSPA